jgi:hypothetical protein
MEFLLLVASIFFYYFRLNVTLPEFTSITYGIIDLNIISSINKASVF